MIHCPEKYRSGAENLNKDFLRLKGELGTVEAQISLAKFLRHNLFFTTELLTGIKLAPFQEVTLRAMLNRNFNMCVWGRGCGKTFIASVFCILQTIFEPGTKILVAGPTFRTARFIFNNIEKIHGGKGAELLQLVFGAKSKRNDQYEWIVNGGSITAIPLSGEKIRGFRANVLVLDEYLLLPEEIIQTVLMPFLVAPQDIKERLEIREIEDRLISLGKLEEKERTVFENNSKMIALSSASYTFENLYKTYQDWTRKIYDEKEVSSATYFISQLGYEALPDHMIDSTIIEEAQDGGQSHSSFQREYCAQFTDGSDSYFSAKKMHECTIPDGESPTTKIKGDSDKKYILAIDPSFSDSPSSDYFAMSIMELDEEKKQCTLVHGYAVAGGHLKNHIKYFYYLNKFFNFELIMIDNAGYQFIDSANESKYFKQDKIKLSFFDFNSDAEDLEYRQMLKKSRYQYNKQSGKKCIKQVFTSSFIRKANEHLKANVDYKRIWFASRITANNDAFEEAISTTVDKNLLHTDTVLDLMETQDDIVYQTKKQCALIEVKSTARGTQTFDLPLHLKKSTSATKARKDNYTTLMLGNWATKGYFDMMDTEDISKNSTFSPIMIP
jgi:hypothetical protein